MVDESGEYRKERASDERVFPKTKYPIFLFQQEAAPERPVVPMRRSSMQTEDSDAGGVFAFVHTPTGLVAPQRSQPRLEPEGVSLMLCASVCCYLNADIRNAMYL